LDVNFNRLREALRVIEEFFRFILEEEESCVALKKMRHSLTGMEKRIGYDLLLKSRDTAGDCFASQTRPEEMNRIERSDVLSANFKRAQEAGRVIEEYSKLSGAEDVSHSAKEIRFSLYSLQKATFMSVESEAWRVGREE
jgi:thiamine-phosphate pyrophosphorylase